MKTLLLSFLIACGPSADVGNAPLGAQSKALEYPQLGEWHKLYIEAREDMRELGSDDEWETLTTYITGLVQVVKNGEKPELRFQPCQVLLPQMAGITPELPSSTVQLASPISVFGQWTEANGEYTLVTPEWSAMVFGATLDDALNDVLPTNKSDSRVVDVESDGKPGVTMRASIGRLYMVMRGMMRLNGVFKDGGLRGTAEYKRDFHIFGDNVFGIAKRQVDSSFESSEFRPAATTGVMTPLQNTPTCADIL